MDLIFLNVSDLLEHLAMLLASTVYKNNFSIRRLVMGINVLQQTACLVVNPITVGFPL